MPAVPEVGDKLLMLGAATTVKATLLLAEPLTLTTTFPVVAPVGTGTIIEVALQLVGAAVVPLKVTVLDPWLEPKPDPAIVTKVPTGPAVGERLLIVGAALATEAAANRTIRSRAQEAPCRGI